MQPDQYLSNKCWAHWKFVTQSRRLPLEGEWTTQSSLQIKISLSWTWHLRTFQLLSGEARTLEWPSYPHVRDFFLPRLRTILSSCLILEQETPYLRSLGSPEVFLTSCCRMMQATSSMRTATLFVCGIQPKGNYSSLLRSGAISIAMHLTMTAFKLP